jgi:hypothetical protein
MWTVMLAALMSVIVVHHVQMYMAIRHMTWWLFAWCVLSLAMIPFCLILVDYIFGVTLIHRQFSDIFAG